MSDIKVISPKSLIKTSKDFQNKKRELLASSKLTLTGIVNLVVNFEVTPLVDEFLNDCFLTKNLYKHNYEIDAIELQEGKEGKSLLNVDEMIFGSFIIENDDHGVPSYQIDPLTGARRRSDDGFVNRPEALSGSADDRYLIIRNMDYCTDFCSESPGEVSQTAFYLFNKFRDSRIYGKCRLILITNKKLKLPFEIPHVELNTLDEYEGEHLLNSYLNIYSSKYAVDIGNTVKKSIVRKIKGLTYSEGGSVFSSAFPLSANEEKKEIIPDLLLKNVRKKINENFMANGYGLTQLTPKRWEDYICPEQSNFTHDVKKMLRDFNEISMLKHDNKEESRELCEALESKVPKTILLYGKGGVGKSAFPVHLAGLLNFDIWDFNIGAIHSKFVGEGADKMRDSLSVISKASHVIIRIDEYDRAMGSTEAQGRGMHTAHKQVEAEFMNWLQNLQEENHFAKNNIILVLTTNHKENITGPLKRSGRVDLVISIDDFDQKSVAKAIYTSADRIYNRGIKAIGYSSGNKLQDKINSFDIEKISKALCERGFTVRDIEVLILEMARYDYYYKNYSEGMPWDEETFLGVVLNSTGSIDTDEELTKELELGDRKYLKQYAKSHIN